MICVHVSCKVILENKIIKSLSDYRVYLISTENAHVQDSSFHCIQYFNFRQTSKVLIIHIILPMSHNKEYAQIIFSIVVQLTVTGLVGAAGQAVASPVATGLGHEPIHVNLQRTNLAERTVLGQQTKQRHVLMDCAQVNCVQLTHM